MATKRVPLKRKKNPTVTAAENNSPYGRLDILFEGIIQKAVNNFDKNNGLEGTLWPTLEGQVKDISKGLELDKKKVQPGIMMLLGKLFEKTYNPSS